MVTPRKVSTKAPRAPRNSNPKAPSWESKAPPLVLLPSSTWTGSGEAPKPYLDEIEWQKLRLEHAVLTPPAKTVLLSELPSTPYADLAVHDEESLGRLCELFLLKDRQPKAYTKQFPFYLPRMEQDGLLSIMAMLSPFYSQVTSAYMAQLVFKNWCVRLGRVLTTAPYGRHDPIIPEIANYLVSTVDELRRSDRWNDRTERSHTYLYLRTQDRIAQHYVASTLEYARYMCEKPKLWSYAAMDLCRYQAVLRKEFETLSSLLSMKIRGGEDDTELDNLYVRAEKMSALWEFTSNAVSAVISRMEDADTAPGLQLMYQLFSAYGVVRQALIEAGLFVITSETPEDLLLYNPNSAQMWIDALQLAMGGTHCMSVHHATLFKGEDLRISTGLAQVTDRTGGGACNLPPIDPNTGTFN